MRIKKLRGHKRIWKEIEHWKNQNSALDLERVKRSGRDYTKIWVSPYSDLFFGDSVIPAPKGETRKRIIKGLLDIYDAWYSKLATLEEPFYLKIWFYENRLTESQVVCAIGDMISFYDTTFPKPEKSKILDVSFGDLTERVHSLNWEQHIDIDFFYDDTVGDPDEYSDLQEYHDHKRWFKNKLLKKHKTYKLEDPTDVRTEYYAFEMGNVWLGGK